MTISLLSDRLISQIAAGEVVERPASVVKELIENALDAGADSIHMMIRGGGRQLIRVSDNGSGIPADEISLAFARHATSKLRQVEDLERIMTLGFRGEALSSIASVSRVAVSTRHRDDEIGVQMRIEGAKVVHNQPLGAPAGTVISVENLFYNTPARLKFLKKEATEKRYITALVTRYAMGYPAVRFILEQDGRELLRTTGSGALADVMVKVFGLESFKQMVEVELADAAKSVRVHGFTSLGSLNRADRNQISLFVNGRWVTDSKLTYAVVQAYHSLLDSGRFPIAALMIDIPPQEVDVNVHPTKAEVRFRDANAVFSVLQRAVREAVVGAGERPRSMTTMDDPFVRADRTTWGGNRQSQTAQLPMDDEPTLPRPQFDDEDLSHIPEGPGAPIKPRTLPLLRVVGQVGATYIIAEGPAGLYLIDQHAAHVRVLYEDLIEQADTDDVPRLVLPSPQTFSLKPKDAQQLEANLARLNALGLDIALFGTHTFQVRAVPETVAKVEIEQLVNALAHALPNGDVVHLIAQYGAVKTGQVLKPEDMQAIVRRLERAQEPFQAPDGTLTLIHMTGDQLAREFGR